MDLDSSLLPSQVYQKDSHIMGIGATLLGALGIGIASMGFGWWNRADYFHHIGEYPNGWVGYDVFAFIGLLLFTVFSPSGVTLLYVGVSTLMRLWGGMLGLAVFGALGVVLVVVGSLGMVWGNETMQCLGIFCVDTAKYALVPGARPEAGLGFRSMIGMTAFFSLLPMGLVILTQVALRAFRLDRRLLAPRRQRLVLERTHVVPFAVVAFIFIVCWALVSFYMPNSWDKFTAGDCAKCTTAAAVVVGVYAQLGVEGHLGTEDVPKQHLFLLVPAHHAAECCCHSREPQRAQADDAAVSAAAKLYLRGGGLCPSDGVHAAAVLPVLGAGPQLYWQVQRRFKWDCHIRAVGAFARSAGGCAPVTVRVSCESVLCPAFHYGGVVGVLDLGAQGAGVRYAAGDDWSHGGVVRAVRRSGELPRGVFSVPPVEPPGYANDFTVPLITLTTWFMLVAMGVFALEPVRRRFFELFYYLHIAAFYMIVPTVLWHAAAAWEYFLPGLTVWFMDRLLRMYRSASTVEVVSAVASDALWSCVSGTRR
ncbi:hypothetical protein LSM04_008610 [Trypanosoma melophagium]|uniref:uncharacterized protein n=1 Tax=Trypanosoma melophagium TaxID=715481 RepID=UPI00351A8DB8|nr:hypothetical protein LSM04_008610 [Trypanosoma melophagium]